MRGRRNANGTIVRRAYATPGGGLNYAAQAWAAGVPCCCGEPCALCDAIPNPDYPALVCPPQTGLTVTLAGIELAEYGEDVNGNGYGPFDWTLSPNTSHCLRTGACDTEFVSKGPVATAGYGGGALNFYLTLRFVCGNPASSDPDEAPYVEAYITGGGSPIFALFSTRLSDNPDTHAAWSRTCALGGYAMNNALTSAAGQQSINQDEIVVGTGGTLATGAPCSPVPCDAPGPSSVLIDMLAPDGTPLSLTTTPGSYAFTDNVDPAAEVYNGQIAFETIRSNYQRFDGHRLRLFKRGPGGTNPLVCEWFQRCDGESNAILGSDYRLVSSLYESNLASNATVS